MSQSESLMLILLGAVLALIAVIVFSRGIWEMAVRVMRRRRENEVSPTIISLEAQRDKLRAEHAMMATKMEATISEIKTKMTEQTAEVSRTRNTMLGLQQDVADRDRQLEDRARDLAMLAEKLVEAEALASSRAKALAELDDQLAQKSQEASALRGEIAKLQMEAAQVRDAAAAYLPGSVQPITTMAAPALDGAMTIPTTRPVPASAVPFVPTPQQFTAPQVTSPQSSVQQIVEQARMAMQSRELEASETEKKRTKVLRSATSGGISAITERLKSMQRTGSR
jgi:ABC-type transporter Mla subunit MlaD